VFRDVLGLDRAGEGERTLGADQKELEQLRTRVAAMPAKRQLHLTAVAILCAWEDVAGTHTWRHDDPKNHRVLRQMEAWGYPLSAIERRAAGYQVDDAVLLGEVADDDVPDDGPLVDFPDQDGDEA